MMKNILFPILIALLATVACSHQDKTPKTEISSTTAESDSYLTMKINGKEWVADEDLIGNLGLLGPGQFGLGGAKTVNGEEQHLSIAIHNVTGPGTYQTTAEQVYNVAQYALNQQSNGDVKIFKSQKDGQSPSTSPKPKDTTPKALSAAPCPVGSALPNRWSSRRGGFAQSNLLSSLSSGRNQNQ